MENEILSVPSKGRLAWDMRTSRAINRTALSLLLALPLLTACAAVEGYPTDPEDTDKTLVALQASFGPDSEMAYYGETDAGRRQALRNQLVYNRIHAYDIEFDDFEKSLYVSGNTLSTGSDLVTLILNGLGATVGGAATKSALAAASAGVVGANGAVNKDLYYQRTLPALIAQLEAGRSQVKVTIYSGLTQTDANYSLAKADVDLEALKKAGSIPSAITGITQQAGNANQNNNLTIDAIRSGSYSTSSSTSRIVAWLYPGGKATDDAGNPVSPNASNLAALMGWMQKDTIDPSLSGAPFAILIYNKDAAGRLEADRLRAITDLKIP